jgi:hypothetical protein
MKWTSRKPRNGDMRLRVRFALFPKRMSDEKTIVWLQRYYVGQMLMGVDGIFGYDTYGWQNRERTATRPEWASSPPEDPANLFDVIGHECELRLDDRMKAIQEKRMVHCSCSCWHCRKCCAV